MCINFRTFLLEIDFFPISFSRANQKSINLPFTSNQDIQNLILDWMKSAPGFIFQSTVKKTIIAENLSGLKVTSLVII